MGKTYKNSPIIEALCEFQFEQNSPWDLAIPGIIYDRVQPSFPIRRQATRVSIELPESRETGPQVVSLPLTQFWSEHEQSLIQVGEYLLSVNHVKPYLSWEKFLPLIKEGYNAYREVADPTSIRKVTLRYINRIEFPAQSVNLEDYFEFRPYTGPDLPQHHGAFTTVIQIPYEDGRDVLNLQLSSIASGTASDTVAVMLDLAYALAREGEITFGDVFRWIEDAHSRIEEVFEASITDQLKQTFEEVTE